MNANVMGLKKFMSNKVFRALVAFVEVTFLLHRYLDQMLISTQSLLLDLDVML